MVSMNRLTAERRAQILGMMVEGNSIRAIVRMTGVSKNTVVKLLEDAGEAFSAYHTKLVPSWRIGDRSGETATEFVCDLSKRLANRVQVTSDGHRAYLEAIEAAFGADVDYAQLIKLYGDAPTPRGRYSPAQIQGSKTFCCTGKPDLKHISTSYVERHNLTIRMSNRRLTRLTNAFSKKAENHAYSMAIYLSAYIKPCVSPQRWRPA